jgi:hypothetical protein
VIAPENPDITGQAEICGVAYLAVRSACGISRRLVMSESDVRKTAELKERIEKELSLLIEKLDAGTIDRKKLDAGLCKVKELVARMPPHSG